MLHQLFESKVLANSEVTLYLTSNHLKKKSHLLLNRQIFYSKIILSLWILLI